MMLSVVVECVEGPISARTPKEKVMLQQLVVIAEVSNIWSTGSDFSSFLDLTAFTLRFLK